MGKPIPGRIRAAALAALRSGEHPRDVSARTGIWYGTLRRWAETAGIPFPDKQTRYDSTARTTAVKRIVAGASYRDVAREFGLSRRSVARWCRDAGVASQWQAGYNAQEAR